MKEANLVVHCGFGCWVMLIKVNLQKIVFEDRAGIDRGEKRKERENVERSRTLN